VAHARLTLNYTIWISTPSSFNLSCKSYMIEVIGRQTVSQFVKIKSTNQYSPFKSSSDNVSSSCVVNSKSSTVSDIFVSIFSLLQPDKSNTATKVRINAR